jgi:hypothetical protein
VGVPVAGIGGNVKAGAITLANITAWSVAAKSDVAETTPFGATGAWATSTATIKKWTAKFDGSTDAADTTGQVALFNGLGSTFAVEFDIDATHHWAGSAILTGIDPKSSAKGINDIGFSVDGTGPLTFT